MAEDQVQPTELGSKIYQVAVRWRREIDLRVREFGLTDASWRPLLYIGRLGDGLRQTDLAAALMIENPSLVRLVDVLERAGLVERLDDPDDRRSKRLRMTPAGRATYEKVACVHAKLSNTLVKDVSADELRLCRSVLDRILAAIETHAAPREESP